MSRNVKVWLYGILIIVGMEIMMSCLICIYEDHSARNTLDEISKREELLSETFNEFRKHLEYVDADIQTVKSNVEDINRFLTEMNYQREDESGAAPSESSSN